MYKKLIKWLILIELGYYCYNGNWVDGWMGGWVDGMFSIWSHLIVHLDGFHIGFVVDALSIITHAVKS